MLSAPGCTYITSVYTRCQGSFEHRSNISSPIESNYSVSTLYPCRYCVVVPTLSFVPQVSPSRPCETVETERNGSTCRDSAGASGRSSPMPGDVRARTVGLCDGACSTWNRANISVYTAITCVIRPTGTTPVRRIYVETPAPPGAGEPPIAQGGQGICASCSTVSRCVGVASASGACARVPKSLQGAGWWRAKAWERGSIPPRGSAAATPLPPGWGYAR
jgi:hypothetical protein